MGHLNLPCSSTPMCVYTITNKGSGKVYMGQTTRLAGERWYKHAWATEGSAISAAIKKYGVEAFEFSVIDNAENLDQLNHKEKFWIDRLNSMSPNGYNLLQGGKNRTPSEETRRKQSEAKKGKRALPEHVEKRAAALRAKEWTPEQKAAMSKRASEFRHSDSTKTIMSEKRKAYLATPEGIAQLVASLTGLKRSDAVKEKMSLAKIGKRPASRCLNKTNKTGRSGVFFREGHGSAGAYSAHVMVDGKMKSKTFGCLKRGKQAAFILACEWRDEMELTTGLFTGDKK